jgi:hypothetical protein
MEQKIRTFHSAEPSALSFDELDGFCFFSLSLSFAWCPFKGKRNVSREEEEVYREVLK